MQSARNARGRILLTWRWVYPGITASTSFSARETMTFSRSLRYPSTLAVSSIYPESAGFGLDSSPPHSLARTSQMRMSVATWSFLLLPVCSLPPISLPTISLSRRSLAVWMSSSSGRILNWRK